MSILFCTPAYGSQVWLGYFHSCMELKQGLTEMGVKNNWLTNGNESLITRGRNTMVATFLKSGKLEEFMDSGYERLMFIDADIEFDPDDVGKLWNLDKDVAVGAYPMKKKVELDLEKMADEAVGRDAVLAALKKAAKPYITSAWKNGKLADIEGETEPFKVDYAGTGFMMIKRGVFEKMRQKLPHLWHNEGIGDCWAFFDCELHGHEEARVYLSEDYNFCQRWRDMDGEIWCDPTIKLKHWGVFAYGS